MLAQAIATEAGRIPGQRVLTMKEAEGTMTQDEISTLHSHTCARTDTNEVFCWGEDPTEGAGDGWGTTTVIPGLTSISISAGLDSSCSVTVDGRVLCWGTNNVGQSAPLVDAGVINNPTPVFPR